MSKVRTVARGITQQEAAKLLGVAQPRLNLLLKGKIEKFSLDALVNILAKAGMRIKITVRKARLAYPTLAFTPTAICAKRIRNFI